MIHTLIDPQPFWRLLRASALLVLMIMASVIIYEIPAAMGSERWLVRLVNLWSFAGVMVMVDRRFGAACVYIAVLGSIGAFLDDPRGFRASWAIMQAVGACGWVALPFGSWGASWTAERAIHALAGILAALGAVWAAWLGWIIGAGPVDPFEVVRPISAADRLGLGGYEIAAMVIAFCLLAAVWVSRPRSTG